MACTLTNEGMTSSMNWSTTCHAKALAAGKGGPKEGEAEAEAASEESSSPFPAQCDGYPRFPRPRVE